MTRLAATKCFEAAGLSPGDIDVVELHDCFSANELITYEALGLCAEGKKAARFTPFLSTCSPDGVVSFTHPSDPVLQVEGVTVMRRRETQIVMISSVLCYRPACFPTRATSRLQICPSEMMYDQQYY